MHREIERKFLVDALPTPKSPGVPVPVQQGYLARGNGVSEVRLRRQGDEFTMTIKQGSGLERLEYETPLTREQFDVLWPATDGARVAKQRTAITLPTGVAHLDVFEGQLAGLITVEVEFEDTKAAGEFTPPAWFGREVTGERGYANQNLCDSGIPE